MTEEELKGLLALYICIFPKFHKLYVPLYIKYVLVRRCSLNFESKEAWRALCFCLMFILAKRRHTFHKYNAGECEFLCVETIKRK